MPSRRRFLQSVTAASAALCLRPSLFAEGSTHAPLSEFDYSQVSLAPSLAQSQFEQTQSVLLSLNEDSLLKPFRLRAGLPAPGPDLGGWYDEVPLEKTESGGHGFAPAHCFGQWISALSRGYAIHRDPRTRTRVERLLALYEAALSPRFYQNFRFPAYNYDKLVIALIDAHQFAALPNAFSLLNRTTDAAFPHLPPRALDRDEPQRQWRASVGENTANEYLWDESYTMAENLYLAAARGAGERYLKMAPRYLPDETFFNPLSEGRNVLGDHHAYSYANSLSGAMQAYLSTGSLKHLRAATNAFDMITAQSFATGGWGPNESFSAPDSGALYRSLTETHRGFETPCGSYAHFKLTRYLLRATSHGRYGDSMERVFYNTVLGASPLQSDGRAFYYSDYNFSASKTYFPDPWPCCSGTLPQVAADYRLLPYLHDAEGIFVNLYLPSTLTCTAPSGAAITLTQSTAYPHDEHIALTLRTNRPASFAIRLRIPAWASGAALRVNGHPAPLVLQSGFATLHRNWKDGDRLELTLPLALRLEAIDSAHPNTVALLRGPLVLFPIGPAPRIARAQLLAARPLGSQAWQAQGASGPLHLLPFTSINGEPYSTYMNLA